ncbi:MAG TPA: FAD-dependent oxidoreductase [Candidatus Elarobacter sp.]|nr:FAD-dependent oxidoreductase [Candidatus Elarobacter sp.]
MEELRYDVVIAGASLGGVAAALRASALGAKVCLLEASSWIGGQYSAQGLTRGDETEWINGGTGATASYLDFRRRARAWYTTRFVLSEAGKKLAPFDPGAPDHRYVSNLRISPRAAHETLLAMLAATTPRVTVTTETRVVAAQTSEGRVTALVARAYDGAPARYAASYFLDATDLGELLALADVPHRLGAESRADFGEPNAPAAAHANWIQPITVPLALERRPDGENHTIPKPPGYDEMVAAHPFTMLFGASGVFRVTGSDSLFNYRQFVAAANFADPSVRYDLTTINDASNDYRTRSIPTGNPDLDAATVVAARARSLAYAYWLQTACPRDDGKGHGYPNLRVATEVFGTYDGCAPQPYIRESRRIVARTTVRQQDIVTAGARANRFADSCGIGYYHLDMHTVEGMNGYDGASPKPFQIPLGALVSTTFENLIPACKNLGVTHITNSAYRVHPIEWNTGESAGALAAFCLKRSATPSGVLDQPPLLRELQHELLSAGVPLYWWTDVPFGGAGDLFAHAQLAGVRGFITRPSALAFAANEPFGADERAAADAAAGSPLPWPSGTLSRGDAARFVVQHLGL